MGEVCPSLFFAMRISVRKIALSGIIAAAYAAVTVATASFAYGPIQFRIAEALAVLCCFEPTAVAGVTVGCLIANLFSTVSPLDLVMGTFATLIAALAMTRCRRAWTMILPNVISNGVIIGLELALVLRELPFWTGFLTYGLQVALGELAVMTVLGIPLFYALKRTDALNKALSQTGGDK